MITKYISLSLSISRKATPNNLRSIAFLHRNKFNFSKQSNIQKISKQKMQVEDIIPQINRPHQSDGGIYSVESIMPKQQVSEQLKLRLQDLRKRHQILRTQLSQKINIPFLLCGVNRKTYHQSFGYMPERVMSYYGIHHTTITDYLLKIYKASLFSIPDRNQSFMNQYWEQGFKDKVLESIQITKSKGFHMKITQEKKFVQEFKESCKIVDAVMIRGISTRRQENQSPKQYHKYSQDKQFGLITYTPQYLTQDNQKFVNPQTNKTIYQGYEKMILRVLVLVKSPLRLVVPELPIPDQLNTYEHLVIMQNEMIAPPFLQSRYKLQTLVEWLGKYRFGEWRVVDIDNFMRGNSPFRLHQPEHDQIEQIFKNTIMDKSYYCNIRDI